MQTRLHWVELARDLSSLASVSVLDHRHLTVEEVAVLADVLR